MLVLANDVLHRCLQGSTARQSSEVHCTPCVATHALLSGTARRSCPALVRPWYGPGFIPRYTFAFLLTHSQLSAVCTHARMAIAPHWHRPPPNGSCQSMAAASMCVCMLPIRSFDAAMPLPLPLPLPHSSASHLTPPHLTPPHIRAPTPMLWARAFIDFSFGRCCWPIFSAWEYLTATG